jgi:hypothetical protein
MISRFPGTLAGTGTTAIQFCRNLLLSEQKQAPPKKKKKKTQRECTLRGLHRENEERETHTQRMRGRCAQRDESSGSSQTKELVCMHHLRTSVENEYLPQVAAAGELTRVEEMRMRRRRRSSLQT